MILTRTSNFIPPFLWFGLKPKLTTIRSVIRSGLFEMGSLPISNIRNVKTHTCLPVQARNNPQGLSRVAPVLRNRRQHAAGCAALGYGNSGHLKREPYPFQMSDTIPRFRGRVFNNTLPVYYQHVVNISPTRYQHNDLLTGW